MKTGNLDAFFKEKCLTKNTLTFAKLNFYVDMSVWLFVGKQYYRLNGTFIVPIQFVYFFPIEKYWESELETTKYPSVCLFFLVNIYIRKEALHKSFLLHIRESIIELIKE